MNYHDPIRQSNHLRQTLSQNKKPIGFFISAGCPLAVRMPDKQWPLIPDVANLTLYVEEEILKKTELAEGSERSIGDAYKLLLDEVKKMGKTEPNVEDILSFLRGMIQISKGASEIRGFNENELTALEKLVCETIAKRLRVSLPDNNTPYHKLAKWVKNIDRDIPVEIFTTNYDLLLEEAFESLQVPYFDGFVGTRYPFFDLRAVEDGLIPKHWTRLWKIHGSINWYLKEGKHVYRATDIKGDDSYIIHPSHLKYDQSRKMPYLVLIDRLNKFLRQNSAVLLMTGYSFSDDHLNDTIMNALRANPTSMVIALLHGNLTKQKDNIEGKEDNQDQKEVVYEKALKLAEDQANLSIWSFDEAVIGTIRGRWKPSKEDYEREENIADAVKKEKDDKVNEIMDGNINYEFILGDFAVLGNFLQQLIGKDQFITDDDN